MTTNNHTPSEAEIEAAYIRGSNSANAANKLLRDENATLREKLAKAEKELARLAGFLPEGQCPRFPNACFCDGACLGIKPAKSWALPQPPAKTEEG